MFQRFAGNAAGRDLIVGDIHGAFSKLRGSLDSLGFDPERDRLFSVGDLVDRGPESGAYGELLCQPWFHAVRGNHEEMAILFAAGKLDPELYLLNGGAWNIERTPREIRQTAEHFSVLPYAIELDTPQGAVGIVHAGVPGANWQNFTGRLTRERPDEDMLNSALWARERLWAGDDTLVQGVRAVVTGHTVVPEPVMLGNVIHIDTGGWLESDNGGRDFTILDAATL